MTTTTVDPRGVAPSSLIAREIRAEMGRQQLSNRRLAMMLGVSPMWVNRRVSTGDTELTVNDVQLIADALRVAPARLLVGWLPRLDSNQQPAGYTAAISGYPTRLATAA